MERPAERKDGPVTAEVLAGGGEMGALMRSLDWAQTPIGPVESWPQSLRTSVSICLASRFPMLIWWGPELVMLYNDAYRPMLGASKHPRSMGQRGRECWPEIWDIIGPMLEGVLTRGEATWSNDQLLPLDRNGYVEECYFTFSYSPIRDESGGIGGVFTAVTETTGRVLGERRLRTLRELGGAPAQAGTAEEACALMARTLARNPADIPFALLYLLDADGKRAHLVGTTGLEPETPASPRVVDLLDDAPDAQPWPLARVARTGQAEVVHHLLEQGALPTGQTGADAPQEALVLPVALAGQEQCAGILITGISPRHALDEEYRGFFELIVGQVATAVANVRAYEEARRRTEALAELDRAKTAFFSNVSHEFRTPLTLLLGPVEDALADAHEPLSPAQRERLEMARRNGLRLLRLVNTLLDFSRIEAGRTEAVYEPTDLAALTTELASMFRSAIEHAGLQLVIECQPLPEPVYVDREMWEKIVLNLISNAVKFTFAGQIRVGLHPLGEQAALTISDTGTGIPEAELPQLFERFHRVRGARARTQEGTGIGLALVQELVRLHGGTIRVASVVDAGTTFTVTVPCGSAHLHADRIQASRTLASTALGAAPYVEEALRWLPGAAEGGQAQPLLANLPAEAADWPGADGAQEAAAPQPSQRILLADDNADMREYVRRLLSQRWTVETVGDGSTALEAALAQPPDLVLSDVMMPGLDGFQLLRALRADPRTSAVPIVLLSARAGEEAAVEGLQAGADDYLIKPFSARELLARVSAHLEMAHLRREAANQMSAFLGLASHELRTPLTSLRLQIQTSRRRLERLFSDSSETPDSTLIALEPFQKDLRRLEHHSRRLNRLVGDLLEVSRIQAEKLDLRREDCDLNAIVQEAVEELQAGAPGRKIRLTLPDEQTFMYTDRDRLVQVVTNYLMNALKYAPADQPIDVVCQLEEQQARVLVRDHGPGIPLEDQQRIWERFQQVKGAAVQNGVGMGLGLGLYICKSIIEQHGGQVGVESQPGEGATFWFTLPVAASQPPVGD